MIKTETLYQLEDKYMKDPGLYLLWLSFFISYFVIFLVDDTQGPSRDYAFVQEILSLIYLFMSTVNRLYGNGLPSTFLMSAGVVHQYGSWITFAYYGGDDVVGRHPLGVMNYINLVILGLFTIDTLIKSWYIIFYSSEYQKYANSFLKEGGTNVVVSA